MEAKVIVQLQNCIDDICDKSRRNHGALHSLRAIEIAGRTKKHPEALGHCALSYPGHNLVPTPRAARPLAVVSEKPTTAGKRCSREDSA